MDCWRDVRFEVFTAVTMKNVVFWDIKTQFLPNRRHITFPLQSPAGICYVRFEFSTNVTMKNVDFWDVTLCGFCKDQDDKNWRARNNINSN
jgi:hypothetical protein